MTDATLEAAVGDLDLGSTEPQTGAANGTTVEDGALRIGKRCYVGNLAWRTSWQDLKDRFNTEDIGKVVYANVVGGDTGRSKGWGIVEFETPEEAVRAVNKLNGAELNGRDMLVREDREDRDVKAYNRDNGVESRAPRSRRDRKGRGGRGPGDDRDLAGERGAGDSREGNEGTGEPRPRRERAPRRESNADSTSGLQVVVQGLPWAFTQEQLEPMFEEHGTIDHCEVVYGRDGRSRGYGTVRYETTEEAEAAIQHLHGSELEGRMLTVRLDRYA